VRTELVAEGWYLNTERWLERVVMMGIAGCCAPFISHWYSTTVLAYISSRVHEALPGIMSNTQYLPRNRHSQAEAPIMIALPSIS